MAKSKRATDLIGFRVDSKTHLSNDDTLKSRENPKLFYETEAVLIKLSGINFRRIERGGKGKEEEEEE